MWVTWILSLEQALRRHWNQRNLKIRLSKNRGWDSWKQIYEFYISFSNEKKTKKQSNKSIVYKKTDDWYIVWQEVVQRVTTKWCNKWQHVAHRMKANESDFRFQNETIMRCITTIYSAKSFWKYYVKQNIYRSSYRTSYIKKMLLKISQFSHENTWWPNILLREDSNTSVFL